ncbi:hypothetical protein CERSUDRAFT_116616 [Gelatoporia subvermispora B]|uniref:Uncharacterized protein n=1 Tax=Ceriporiopsis subvermispora (strain B) TaxID=914234 RepID=M2QSX3_CERS8|nr:hypothetical protein CERSUDRAFT_116616 [Gelatoporia subvermispora B]
MSSAVASSSNSIAFPSPRPYSPNQAYSLYSTSCDPARLSPVQYDERGRQKKYTESSAQRRERVEFLRRREWTRRIADWINDSASVKSKMLASPYSVEDFLAATQQRHFVEPDEPYVIYTASPASSGSRADTPPAASLPPLDPPMSPSMSPVHTPLQRQRSRGGPHSRHSSLSSISEEDESQSPVV